MNHTVQYRRGRGGSVRKVIKEAYARDDVEAGLPGVSQRAGVERADAAGSELDQLTEDVCWKVVAPDALERGMDMWESDSPLTRNVIVPDVTAAALRKSAPAVWRRVAARIQARKYAWVFVPASAGRQFAEVAAALAQLRAAHNTPAHDEGNTTASGETTLDAARARLAGTPQPTLADYLLATSAWYARAAGIIAPDLPAAATPVCLLTGDDRISALAQAHATAVTVLTLRDWLGTQRHESVELLMERAPAPASAAISGVGQKASSDAVYASHLSDSAAAAAVAAGEAWSGTLRTSRHVWYDARVSVRGLAPGDDPVSVRVRGRSAINRATDGDQVTIVLDPVQAWSAGESAGEAAAEPVSASADAAVQTSGPLEADEVAGTDAGVPRQDSTAAPPSSGEIAAALARGMQPTGQVIAIQKRAWRQLCGSLETDEDAAELGMAGRAVGGSTWAMFVPVDPRWPRIRIETRQREALLDKRVVVALDAWPDTSVWPRGHYVRTLGKIGDRDVETEVVLLEHDIPQNEFSAAVMACLPPSQWVVTPENSGGRRDLRDVPVCSIDPPGCRDIDDALHAIELPNGNWQCGVHIADVTHFVAAGCALDLEAASRGNTTYLVQRRLDMLPKLLTEQLCSLRGGVDRFAFSVTWEMTPPPAAKVLHTEFFKSVIHSKAAMTYEQAQNLLDAPIPPASSPKHHIAGAVHRLTAVARALRARRVDAGALTLASPEVKFALDQESGDPLDVRAYEHRETNSVVEEFMLLANITVAARIAEVFPRAAMLRRHPSPPARAFDGLLAAAKAVGVTLDVSSSKALADSLDAADLTDNAYFNRLLRILTTRCMAQAEYFPSGELPRQEWGHYGLAAPIYTHFTSPIRRYADVVVHRLLAATLRIAPLPGSYDDPSASRELAANLNKRHLNSQLAGRASAALHTHIFFQGKLVVEPAMVMSLQSGAVTVLVPRFGVEHRVRLGPKSAVNAGAAKARNTVLAAAAATEEQCHYDASSQCITGPTPDLHLQVFDAVTAALFVQQLPHGRRALRVAIVHPPWHRWATITEAQGPDVKLQGSAAPRSLSEVPGPAAAAKKNRGQKKRRRA